MYYWNKKRTIPSPLIIKHMPLDDINNYYTNNNWKIWVKLLNDSGLNSNEEAKLSFFKLCYVLGIFSTSANIRDKAAQFIEDTIVGKLSEEEIILRFKDFDLNNRFDKKFADFFMKYYTVDFMKSTIEGQETDLLALSYNNFKNVNIYYPHKNVHSNRRTDMLTPELVKYSILSKKYKNIIKGNEHFAALIGRYGYTQLHYAQLKSINGLTKR